MAPIRACSASCTSGPLPDPGILSQLGSLTAARRLWTLFLDLQHAPASLQPRPGRSRLLVTVCSTRGTSFGYRCFGLWPPASRTGINPSLSERLRPFALCWFSPLGQISSSWAACHPLPTRRRAVVRWPDATRCSTTRLWRRLAGKSAPVPVPASRCREIPALAAKAPLALVSAVRTSPASFLQHQTDPRLGFTNCKPFLISRSSALSWTLGSSWIHAPQPPLTISHQHHPQSSHQPC